MNASVKRTLRLGITAGLSLGAIVGMIGCAEETDQVELDTAAARRRKLAYAPAPLSYAPTAPR